MVSNISYEKEYVFLPATVFFFLHLVSGWVDLEELVVVLYQNNVVSHNI